MDETRDPFAGLVRRAAATVADYPADAAQVRRRWQRRRRRRAAVGAVGLAATVAVAAGVLPILLGERGTTPVTGGTTAAAPPAAPAQRLLLDGAWLSTGGQRGPDTPSVGEISELLPDGEVVRHRLPDLDGWSRLATLPAGGLVGLGYDDLRPGVPRADGPAVTDLSVRLAVLSAAGGVEALREVGGPGKPVKLLAATAGVAYLWRPAGLVAHDLGTGDERAVPTGGVLPGLQDRSATSRIDVAGDRLVVGDTPTDRCRLRVVDLRTGATAEHDLRRARCAGIGRLRVSPDGRLAAIAYQRATVSAAGGTPDRRMWVAVVDLDDGRLTADTVVAGPAAGTPGFAPKQPAGMAWSDNGTLRVATTAGAGRWSPESVYQQQIRAGHN
jgi:hypothetical protein